MKRERISLTNNFQQAGERYRSLVKVERSHLVGNLIDDLGKDDKPIQRRMVKNLKRADSVLGNRVATGLGLK